MKKMKKFVVILVSIIIIVLLIAPLAEASSKQTVAIANKNASTSHVVSKAKQVKKGEKIKPDSKESYKNSKDKQGETEGETEPEEAAWKIKGWKIIFSVLSVVFFGLAINLLPKLIADKSSEEHH